MNYAYGWAFSRPVRKVYYNITITGLSVAVALIIGTIELVSILPTSSSPHGPLAWVGGLDLNHVGFAIVGLFVADLGGRAHRVAGRPHRGALVGRAVGRDRLTPRHEGGERPRGSADVAVSSVACSEPIRCLPGPLPEGLLGT